MSNKAISLGIGTLLAILFSILIAMFWFNHNTANEARNRAQKNSERIVAIETNMKIILAYLNKLYLMSGATRR